MAEIIKTTFLLRRGYEEVWIRNNPILQCGEPAFTIDKNGLKIGDGIHAWRDLEYINDADINLDNYITREEFEQLEEKIETINNTVNEIQNNYVSREEIKNINMDADTFKIVSAPQGTLVRIENGEIRIMCPKDTEWVKQESGENANPNQYYIGLKIYAPNEDINSFKESLAKTMEDNTMYYFDNNDFAGVEENGRKFSIVWLPVALYNGETWTYYGVNSSERKYVGWNYIVEWYNKDGLCVATNVVRINLSNEDCHNIVEPYYMGSINVNKLSQNEGEVLVLYGGSASDNI